MGLSLTEGFLKAASMILVSEIGDKTFFVAALMAMRHPRRIVLAGSLAALWLMTVLSALFGWAAPSLLPRKWTNLLATALFFVFGLRSLYDGITMTQSRASEEMKEVEAELDKVSSASIKPTSLGDPSQLQDETKEEKSARQRINRFFSPIFLQTFTLVFLGEWGDKSQIATIGLGAEDNVVGVAIGGCLGHAICSGAAVWGGRHLATRISERMVAICGGLLFLAFSIHSLFSGHQNSE